MHIIVCRFAYDSLNIVIAFKFIVSSILTHFLFDLCAHMSLSPFLNPLTHCCTQVNNNMR